MAELRIGNQTLFYRTGYLSPYYKAPIRDEYFDMDFESAADFYLYLKSQVNRRLWRKLRYKSLFLVTLDKFRQNPHLIDQLIRTTGQFLYCSPVDRIMGIGYNIDDTDTLFFHKADWGQNLQGKVLEEVRFCLSPYQKIPF